MLELDLKICQYCAEQAYKGFTRRDGSSMYDHAIRLSNLFARMGSSDMAAVALLHDVLPCTETTKKDLVEICIVKPVMELLVAYMKSEDESIIEYYTRLGQDPILRYIKAADILEDLLCDPTEDEYREWQYGLMLLNKMPERLVNKPNVLAYLDTKGE